VSQDRASRFIVSWTAGPRVETLAEVVITQTRARTAQQAGGPWFSDGWPPYAETIDQVYRDPQPTASPRVVRLVRTEGVALTQTVKHRRGRRLVRVDVRATIGPVADQPYPVHIERLNGVWRDRLACLTRKTHAFAKRVATWDALLSLAIFEHNWLRPHVALRQAQPVGSDGRRYQRRTPAMVLGLTHHVWSLSAFLTALAYPCH
jgi:IS1 family transposase